MSIFVLNQEKLPRCHLSQLETRIQRSANDVCYYHSNPVVEKTRWSKFDSYFFWGEVPKPTLGGRAVLCIHKESGVNPWSNKQKNYAANLLQTVDCARLSSKSGVMLLKILEYLVFLLSIDLSQCMMEKLGEVSQFYSTQYRISHKTWMGGLTLWSEL